MTSRNPIEGFGIDSVKVVRWYSASALRGGVVARHRAVDANRGRNLAADGRAAIRMNEEAIAMRVRDAERNSSGDWETMRGRREAFEGCGWWRRMVRDS